MPDLVSLIITNLHASRIDLSNKKSAQQQIAQILDQLGEPFLREPRLTAQDIPDFLVESVGLAIEVKLRTSGKIYIYRQLVRYAKLEPVRQILLVTNLAMGLPPEIDGKPAYYVSLGRGWL